MAFPMKSFCLMVAAFIIIPVVLAPKKPAGPAAAPSQAEINKTIREAQQAIDGLSAEDKRQLDSMGIHLRNTREVAAFSTFAAANAPRVPPDILVPKKDAVRIAAVNGTPLLKTSPQSKCSVIKAELESEFVKPGWEK